MKRLILNLLPLVMLGAIAAHPGASATISATPSASPSASPTAGCEGFASYRKELLTAGTAYRADLLKSGFTLDDSPFVYTNAQWTAWRNVISRYVKALNKIQPPIYAIAWHNANIEHFELKVKLADDMIRGDTASAFGMDGVSDYDAAVTKKALAEATAQCSEMTNLPDELLATYGVNAYGMPVPTPDPKTHQ
jgi:hypothetical protein